MFSSTLIFSCALQVVENHHSSLKEKVKSIKAKAAKMYKTAGLWIILPIFKINYSKVNLVIMHLLLVAPLLILTLECNLNHLCFFGLLLPLWCFSFLVNCYFQVSFISFFYNSQIRWIIIAQLKLCYPFSFFFFFFTFPYPFGFS